MADITDTPDGPDRAVARVTIEEEMRGSYLDYAMSVIVSRALPDIRDGLKPVHRRILYAMKTGGYDSSKPFRKSARIVGDVMGQYHPHGDQAIYDALVRMAQDFSMRLPLVEGQGNFGSMDGDPPAAMRYTEARLQKAAEALLEDYDKETVDYQNNYDDSQSEPTVLPARFPNLLVNGAGGIAVGMATNIPPHNLGEVLDACCAYAENPDITLEELMQIVPGPDFPTGGEILGRAGIRSAHATGHGSIIMRGKAEINDKTNQIIITEIPYQVNRERLIERMKYAAAEGTVEGVREIRNESDRDGLRLAVDLKRDSNAEVTLNQLYRHTPLQSSFGANMLALNSGRPQMVGLREIIAAFIDFRHEVITRRTAYELAKARERAHVMIGLALAVANIDEVIALIRKAPDPATARAQLMARAWPTHDLAPLIELVNEPGAQYDAIAATYHMTETQARAILDLRLHRLTGLERDKIGSDLQVLIEQIKDYLRILTDADYLRGVMIKEMREVKEKFATPRRTQLTEAEFETDLEDLIQREEMVVTVTHGGYIKRVPLSTYRAQRRGGKGRAGMATKDEDFVTDLFVTSTHTPVLFFTSKGLVHKLKVYRLPLGTPQSKGKALVNLLPIDQDERVTAILRLPEDEDVWEQHDIVFATSQGKVRRNKLSDFRNIRANGLIAMKLEEQTETLIAAKLCQSEETVMLASRAGKCIRFPVEDVRVFSGRTSTGVRGMKLAKGDEIVSMSILAHVEATPEERSAYLRRANAERRGESDFENGLSDERYAALQAQEEFILIVSDRGMGKRSSAYEYRISGRGGQGIWNMAMTSRVGKIVAAFPVEDQHQVMLVSDQGKLIRLPIEGMRPMARQTQGVRLFNVSKDEHVVSVAWLTDEEGEEADLADAETAEIGETEESSETDE